MRGSSGKITLEYESLTKCPAHKAAIARLLIVAVIEDLVKQSASRMVQSCERANLKSCILSSGRSELSGLRVPGGQCDEVCEYGSRETIAFPCDFRVPLHAENELSGPGIDDCFDDGIGGPGNWLEAVADRVDGLMVMTVDGCSVRPSQLGKQRQFREVHGMGVAFVFTFLHMFERAGDVARDVLNQCAAAIDIQRLDPKTNCEHRQPSGFGAGQQEEVGLIASGNYAAQAGSGLPAVLQWIYIVSRAGQTDAVQAVEDRVDMIRPRNQWN